MSNIKAISTVSGGTITGVKYTESQIDGDSFEVFFENYYKWLTEDNLVENALSHLRSSTVWKQEENIHKRQNPINAFSIEYNKFTSNKTLGDIQNAIENRKTHLERVIFNAVDFTNGIEFRFQNLDKPTRRLGNGKYIVPRDRMSKIKLGDALAASSAFPGGFEPMGFPNDFFGRDVKLDEVGLMDGGIIDNQGTSSLLTSKEEDSKYKLYFINDVASPDIQKPFKFSSKSRFIKVLTYLSSIPSLIFFSFLTILFFVKNWIFLYSIAIIVTAVMASVQFLFLYVTKQIKRETGILENLFISPRKFGFFLIDRIQSLVKMANDVFLKSARRRNYGRVYEQLKDNVSTNAIYELRCIDGEPENARKWEEIKKYTGEIPDKMKSISEFSSKFDTTLWFGKDDKILKEVVACGEYTSCYNLISYLVTKHPDKIQKEGSAYVFFQELLKLWNQLKKNPYYIVDERKEIFS